LTNDLLSRLADCFTESGLGSRQDAYLIIIPALRYLSKLPSARDALPDIYSHAGKHRKAGDFHEAEKSLKFAWEIALGTHNEHQENTGLDTAMLELGELYRYALFSKDSSQQEFGRKGIFWMQRQPQFASVAEVTNRYIELEKLKRSRPNGGPTAQGVIAAISGNNRIESLWLISQVREVLSPDNKDGRTVLSWAAQQGWPEVVKAALEIGSAIDSADKLNRTPLSYASEHGRDDVIRILMKNQALPIVEDSSRRTPLSYAAAGGFVRVMEILMNDQRVTTLAKDKDLCSPLYWAAKKGKGNATKWLLGKNAVIDDPDRNGLTPLIVALSNRQESTAEILAKEVAKFNISIEKTKAWQWAVENGEWTCAAFLLKLSNEESAKNTSNMVRRKAIYLGLFSPDDYSQGRAETALTLRLGNLLETEITVRVFAEHYIHTAITLETVRGVAGGKYNVVARLWELEGVEASAKDNLPFNSNKRGFKIIDLLLDQLGKEVKITADVVEAAAKNKRSGREVMELLLNKRGGEVIITPEVTQAAAGNEESGKKVIELLFNRRAKVKDIEAIVKIVAGKFDGNIMKLLLKGREEEVDITEEIVQAAAGNRMGGSSVMKILLDKRGKEIGPDLRRAAEAVVNSSR
jgi:ankyrin repeat protein